MDNLFIFLSHLKDRVKRHFRIYVNVFVINLSDYPYTAEESGFPLPVLVYIHLITFSRFEERKKKLKKHKIQNLTCNNNMYDVYFHLRSKTQPAEKLSNTTRKKKKKRCFSIVYQNVTMRAIRIRITHKTLKIGLAIRL